MKMSPIRPVRIVVTNRRQTVNQDLVMYGADWCGDCRRSKAYLESQQIPFTYVDLEEHPDRMSEVIARNNGMRSIPVIVFGDGTHLTEPSNHQIAEKIGISV
jgi:mycoredoxin